MAAVADLTISVTADESEYFKKFGAKKTYVIPNGVDIEEFKYKRNINPRGTKILFVGNFSYVPNTDAIKFFYYDVFRELGDQ